MDPTPFDALSGVVMKLMGLMPLLLLLGFVFQMIFGDSGRGSGGGGAPVVDAREEAERRMARWGVLADDELRARNAFDEWLNDAVLRAEIDHVASPADSGLHAWLERLQAVKSENNGRIVWLSGRANHHPVQEGTAAAVQKQWDGLRKPVLSDSSA